MATAPDTALLEPASARAHAPVELSIVMPCLNEAETLGTCIAKALGFFRDTGVAGEVVIADNGSTDGSQEIARTLGARVVDVPVRGYGAALIAGIRASRGQYVAMGDSDDSYDFTGLMPFLQRLRAGAELVMGNRFQGGIAKGAMPPLHRYLGNPVLSTLGRVLYRAPIGDFHCGLRAFRRDAVLGLGLRSTGMEFASEMVLRSQLSGLRIEEVPTTLSPDGRSRPPHLKSWRDGWRHLKLLLTHAPNWLFLYPGLLLLGLGLAGLALLLPGEAQVGSVRLGVHTMLFCAGAVLLGAQTASFAYLARLFGVREGLWPSTPHFQLAQRLLSVERSCIAGGLCLAAGIALSVAAVLGWAGSGYGDMQAEHLMRLAIPAVLLSVLGLQGVFTGFFAVLIGQPRGSA